MGPMLVALTSDLFFADAGVQTLMRRRQLKIAAQQESKFADSV